MIDKEGLPATKNDLVVDCISRADAERILTDLYHSDICDYCLLDILEDIKALPSVTPIRPKGHWIETHDNWGNGIITDRRYKCSVCHGKHIDPETGEWHEVFDYKYSFCPNCGADMREVKE